MIICGDCKEVMKRMDANSVDSIVTDPPAGISFMGGVAGIVIKEDVIGGLHGCLI